jgi:hypothetical protein
MTTTKADLVEQQTTTVGTGAYTVSGTVAGRRSFVDTLADGDIVPLVITDDAAAFEIGFYTWAETAGTFARTAITASSNAGAAVAWAAGTKRIYLSEHAACALPGVRHNLNAADSTMPGNTDNAALGYGKGSLWGTYDADGHFTRQRLFLLYAFSGSDALWAEIPLILNPLADGASVLTVRDLPGNEGSVQVYGNGYLRIRTGIYWDQGLLGATMNSGDFVDTDGIGHYGDAFHTAAYAHTTDATPTKLAKDGDIAANHSVRLGDGSVVTIAGTVTARDRDSGDHASWEFKVVANCDATTSVVTIDLNTFTSLFASAGASTWAATAVADGTSGIAIQGTGAAAKKIIWSAEIHGSFANQS